MSRDALHALERLGIASNDTALTAFVHAGVERHSLRRFEEATALETAFVDLLRELAPDMVRRAIRPHCTFASPLRG